MGSKLFVVFVSLGLTLNLAAAEDRQDDEVVLKNWPVPFDRVVRHVPATESMRAVAAALPSMPSHFIAVTPCRLVDTRNADGPFGGPMFQAGDTRSYAIPAASLAANCSVPVAAAYSLNFTIANYSGRGNLKAYPTGTTPPLVSTLNYGSGPPLGNAAVVPADVSGSIEVAIALTTQPGPTNVIIDINGYFAAGVVTMVNTSGGLTGGGTGSVSLALDSTVPRLGNSNVWSGTNTFNLGLSANNGRITSLAAPTAATDAANKAYVDAVATPGTGAPVTIGTANAAGTSTLLARADHVHAHGDQPGGTLHAIATTGAAGFMSGADKAKVDSAIATTDARLTDARPASSVDFNTATIAGTVPLTNLPIATTSLPGVVQLASSVATTAGLAVQANDLRLSDPRPASSLNFSTAQFKGTVPLTVLSIATTGQPGIVQLAVSGDTTAGLAVQANDPRLSDARPASSVDFNTATITGTIPAGHVGFPTLLPSGQTLKGSYAIEYTASAADDRGICPISFAIPLAADPDAKRANVVRGGAFTSDCPGAPENPLASPGHLCVYERSGANLTILAIVKTGSDYSFDTSDRWGASVYVTAAAPGRAYTVGSWAVTAR